MFTCYEWNLLTKLIMLKSFEFPRFEVAVFLSGLGLWVLSHCPWCCLVGCWSGLTVDHYGTFPSVAALPRPAAT